MACSNSCNNVQHNECQCNEGNNNSSSFVCIIVLYILLAIIIGSFIIY